MAESNRSNRSPWWIVFGSVLGMIVSNGPVMQFTFGVFMKPLLTQFSTDRGTVSIAPTLGLMLTGLCTPIAGRLVDRFGIRRVLLPGIMIFSTLTACLGLFAFSIKTFIFIYALMGVASSTQTPLAYAKAVSVSFDRNRGIALSVTMAGVGLGVILLPAFVQHAIAAFGWRMAYVGLGVLMFVLAAPAVMFLVSAAPLRANIASATLPGLTVGQALKSRAFWLIGVAIFLVGLACTGMFAHIVALLTDRGVPLPQAAAAISFGGSALIAGRIASGLMLDRLFAPLVAALFFLIPLAGILLLFVVPGAPAGIAATILIGLGLGAEVDLAAFLVSRYFGLRTFGEIYGYLFMLFIFGSSLGPLAMGVCFSQTGRYTVAMAGFAVGLVLAASAMLPLGAYKYGGAPLPLAA
jgi:predicted MFS family arabinose efflux permease